MKKPDIQSLLKWKASLEEQRQTLDKLIAQCDSQLRYFSGGQEEIHLTSNQPAPKLGEFFGKEMDDCILTILEKNKDFSLSKEEIKSKLEEGGFNVNILGFTPKFNGVIGSLVRFGKIDKVSEGIFKHKHEVGTIN